VVSWQSRPDPHNMAEEIALHLVLDVAAGIVADEARELELDGAQPRRLAVDERSAFLAVRRPACLSKLAMEPDRACPASLPCRG
jgi:hypothetical protein